MQGQQRKFRATLGTLYRAAFRLVPTTGKKVRAAAVQHGRKSLWKESNPWQSNNSRSALNVTFVAPLIVMADALIAVQKPPAPTSGTAVRHSPLN
jgi:hypothetical protein